METNELRLGNLVFDSCQNIEKVFELSIFGDLHRVNECSPEAFKPIPLTEDRFKSLNPTFQYLRDFSAFYDLQGLTIEVSGYGLPNPRFFIGGIELKNIHQLQNVFFYLEGKELIINQLSKI